MVYVPRLSTIDQYGLSYKILQDGLSSKIKKDLSRWSIFQDSARSSKMVYVPKLSKIYQDNLLFKIKKDLER